MRRAWGNTTDRILAALESGPATADELHRALGCGDDRDAVSAVLSRLRRPTKRHPKRVHISVWIEEAAGQRRYPRPVYALGNKPCKPKPTRRQRSVLFNASRTRCLARFRNSSVFRFGLSVSELTRENLIHQI